MKLWMQLRLWWLMVRIRWWKWRGNRHRSRTERDLQRAIAFGNKEAQAYADIGEGHKKLMKEMDESLK